MTRALLRRCTPGESEVADNGAPVEAGRSRIVLVCVVKRAIVHRIDSDIAVIAPAIGRGTLTAGSVEKMLLPRQGIQWVRHQTAGVTNLWVDRAAGGTKAERNVALIIGGNAAHPAPGRVRLIRALLEYAPCSRLRSSQFKPAYSSHCIGTYRIIIEQRFMTVGKAAIGIAEHQPIANLIELGGGTRLRDAVPRARTKRSK